LCYGFFSLYTSLHRTLYNMIKSTSFIRSLISMCFFSYYYSYIFLFLFNKRICFVYIMLLRSLFLFFFVRVSFANFRSLFKERKNTGQKDIIERNKVVHIYRHLPVTHHYIFFSRPAKFDFSRAEYLRRLISGKFEPMLLWIILKKYLVYFRE
jgi:hypothetical protein